MAVISRPIGTSRVGELFARAQRALKSGWITVLAYLLLLALGYLLLTPAFAWGQQRLDDVRYGFPRTTHVTGFVGHAEDGGLPTHLTALNLHGQVSILEIPGGDPSQVRVLAAPYLVGADGRYVVPHLELHDLSGDGRDDLLLRLRGEIVVYINDGEGFRLMTPAERASLPARGAGR